MKEQRRKEYIKENEEGKEKLRKWKKNTKRKEGQGNEMQR
jgi:hypothetical protein